MPSDGVFAFAMTLLVVKFELAENFHLCVPKT
jgi:uncharacterized membrane protein